ncbi:MAG: tRNA (adenine-N1)-methyltransferase [Chloroflexi bacterium]|nr:tRNA (adenine-N1)-methyltransferase [Chloroflexota bacterium]MBI3732414.1 tRNA (adenine-N1)-methyltransferase [Chloroflexota bacterium]
MTSTHAQAHELVQLIGADDKRFFVRLTPGVTFHTHRGLVRHDQIIGQPFGTNVHTQTGFPYIILQLSAFEQIMRIKRATAIIYPKDIGYILLKLSAASGARIVEAGTGSGALTLALARAVQPDGHVFTYEERSDMQSLARKNLEAAGVLQTVTMKLRNIAEGFDERDADALFLDVREPQDYLAQAYQALCGGGFFGAIVPTANQVSSLLHGLLKGGWINIEAEELLLRRYKIVPERLRPDDRMVGHTGYLVFARKVAENVAPPAAEEHHDIASE